MSSGQRRNSSVELLKILALLLICICHAVPQKWGDTPVGYVYALDLSAATTSIQRFIAMLFTNFGQIGNVIFIICSAWFLLESQKVSALKITTMIIDAWFVSVGILCLCLFFGYPLDLKTIAKQFFPVTFSNTWFLTCYLLFYSIHPLLNIIIRNLSQKELLHIDIAFVVLYCGVGFVLGQNKFYYNQLIGFIVLYFILAYLKQYKLNDLTSKAWCLHLIYIGGGVWILSQIITNYLGLKIYFFSKWCMRWNTFINPCFILLAVGLLGISIGHNFYHRAVNYISSLSLFIYLIQTNDIFIWHIRYDIWEQVILRFGERYLAVQCVAFGVILFTGGTLFAAIYKLSIHKMAMKFSEVLFKASKKLLYFIDTTYL